jgi:large subunit ribosomal protein L25
MATTVQLSGNVRSVAGKGAARKLRAAQRIPGVLYSKGTDPVMLELDEREFMRAVSGHSVSNLVVDLSVTGSNEPVKTLIREVQIDPVSGAVIHVDLNRISVTERLEVEVPVELDGIPTGVKEFGGILQHAVRSLLIKCMVDKIPDEITLDVSALAIGDSIHVRDLDIPDVEILEDPDTTIASVVPPTVIKEPTAEEAEEEAAEEPAEPEVVGRKKEEEEGEEKE